MIRETNSRAWCLSLYLGKVQNSTGNYVFLEALTGPCCSRSRAPACFFGDRTHRGCLRDKLVLINSGPGRGARSGKTRGADSLRSARAGFPPPCNSGARGLQQLKSARAPASCQTGNPFLRQNYRLWPSSPAAPKRACFSQKSVFLTRKRKLLCRVIAAWVPEIPRAAAGVGGNQGGSARPGPCRKARGGCWWCEESWEASSCPGGSSRGLSGSPWSSAAGQVSSPGCPRRIGRRGNPSTSFMYMTIPSRPLVFRDLTRLPRGVS